MKKFRTVILFVCTLLVVAFIFGNSAKPIPESTVESESLLALIAPFIKRLTGIDITNHMLRKGAHIAEFALLGLMAMLTAFSFFVKRRYTDSWLVTLPFCMLIALSDETVQIFFDRGSQLTDVWVDIAGGVLGIVVGTVVVKLIKYFEENTRRKYR